MLRSGLETLVRENPGLQLEESATNADVVIRDEMGDPDSAVCVPLIVLTDDSAAYEMAYPPASAVLPRTSPAAQIVAAIQAVAAGLMVFPADDPGVHRNLGGAPAGDPPVEPLTRREVEVLEMLAEGLANKMIAHKLDISEHTVKFHVNSILAKLASGSRTEAVMRAIRLGLLKI
jgi:DNA-binding NarL/FixJ family response regulator